MLTRMHYEYQCWIELWLHYASKIFVSTHQQFWTFKKSRGVSQSVGMMKLTSWTIKMTPMFVQEYDKNLSDFFFIVYICFWLQLSYWMKIWLGMLMLIHWLGLLGNMPVHLSSSKIKFPKLVKNRSSLLMFTPGYNMPLRSMGMHILV